MPRWLSRFLLVPAERASCDPFLGFTLHDVPAADAHVPALSAIQCVGAPRSIKSIGSSSLPDDVVAGAASYSVVPQVSDQHVSELGTNQRFDTCRGFFSGRTGAERDDPALPADPVRATDTEDDVVSAPGNHHVIAPRATDASEASVPRIAFSPGYRQRSSLAVVSGARETGLKRANEWDEQERMP